MKKDFSKCQCEQSGWCHLFQKEMTSNPPNWQWCGGLREDQRKAYHDKCNNTARIIKKAHKPNYVDIISFSDNIPKPKNDFAVCVIPANKTATELLDINRQSIQKYAKKCGADYIELTGDQNPNWPMANKYRLFHVSQIYKKTLYLDCDIFIKENAPNIFLITPDDKISAFDEYGIMSYSNNTWITEEQEIILHKFCEDDIKTKYISNGKFENNSMLNGGVLVIPRELSHYYLQPENPYPKIWCFDQHLLTLTLPKDKLYNLSNKFNCEYVDKNFWDNIDTSYFIHINGLIGHHEFRKYAFKQIISGDYTRLTPERFEAVKIAHKFAIDSIPVCEKYIKTEKFKKNKIGLFFNNLTPGGATVWLKNFVKYFNDDITGIVAIEDHPDFNDLTLGLDRGFTIDDMYELYQKSDTIIYWIYMIPTSMKYIPDFWKTNPDNKKIILMSHSSHRHSIHDELIEYFNPDAFVCVDEHIARHYDGILIPPLVQKTINQRNPMPKNVLWHHRLEQNKGLEVLADIIEAMPDYIFHIAGSWIRNIHSEKIVNLVENRILSPNIDNVIYHGNLEDLSKLFTICSVSLSTSVDESFGLSVAESIINGIPTVAHATGLGKYADKIVAYNSYYADWVKEIRICDQLFSISKNQKMFEENYSDIKKFKSLWKNAL